MKLINKKKIRHNIEKEQDFFLYIEKKLILQNQSGPTCFHVNLMMYMRNNKKKINHNKLLLSLLITFNILIFFRHSNIFLGYFQL